VDKPLSLCEDAHGVVDPEDMKEALGDVNISLVHSFLASIPKSCGPFGLPSSLLQLNGIPVSA
jgi:hypothetical protein